MRRSRQKLALVTATVTLFITACGTNTAAPPAASQPSAAPASDSATVAPASEGAAAATAAPAPASDGKLTDVELWAGASVSEAGPPPEDWAAYQKLRDAAGVNLKVTLLPSALNDQDAKINAAAAANNLPDIFQVNRDAWYRLANNGLIAPVDDLLPQMPKRTETHYADENRRKLVTIDGKMYGLPDPGALPYADGLVIRKDWLDKLGLQMPKTLDDFMAVAKAFTENDPDGNGKADTYGFGAYIEGTGLTNGGLGTRFDWVYGAYGVAGVWNVQSAETFGLNVRNPNFMKATEYIKQLNDAKVIDPDWPTLKKDEYRARWKQGKYGMMHENFAALSTVANYKDFDTNFPDGEWVVLPPPTGPEGKSADGVYMAAARIIAVSQKAIDAGKGPAIAKALEWMATDEGYYLLGFGEEGVNYKKDPNGFVTTEGIDKDKVWTAKEQQPLTQLRNMVYVNNDIELKARYVTYETKNGRKMDPLSYWKGFRDQPWTDSTGAAVINPPSNAADFTRYYSEGLVQFVLGQQPLDEANWQAYVDGLDGLGAKDLEAAAKENLTSAGFLK
ncbi:extracellular solute-binding protein [Chloroflexia bacterium SDU3-3]|nr:extracellular solute-binding protein [Chloroflexia bacterium SDU3-3]